MTTASDLRRYHLLKYAEAMENIEAAVSGADLYDRPLTDLNDAQCDYRASSAFRLPLNEVRAVRKSWRRRFLQWIKAVK